jgi:hypothetical protein
LPLLWRGVVLEQVGPTVLRMQMTKTEMCGDQMEKGEEVWRKIMTT